MTMVGLLGWLALAFNLGAAIVNILHVRMLQRRSVKLDALKAEMDANLKAMEDTHQRMHEREDALGNCLAFVVMMAHTPDGVIPDSIRAHARSLIPADMDYKIWVNGEQIADNSTTALLRKQGRLH